MNSSSQNYANQNANINMNTGSNLADLATQAGNARASGYIGSSNAINGAISGVGNGIMNAYLMNQMLKYDKWGGNGGPV
jgi:hypothetical protein